MLHFRVHGKDDKLRYIPVGLKAQRLITEYIVKRYGAMVCINAEFHGFCVHALRATAATNALAHNADITKVQEWLEHANIATIWLYDRRQSRP